MNILIKDKNKPKYLFTVYFSVFEYKYMYLTEEEMNIINISCGIYLHNLDVKLAKEYFHIANKKG